MEELTVNLDGKEYKVNVEEIGDGKIKVYFDGKSYDIETKSKKEEEILKEIEKKKNID